MRSLNDYMPWRLYVYLCTTWHGYANQMCTFFYGNDVRACMIFNYFTILRSAQCCTYVVSMSSAYYTIRVVYERVFGTLRSNG